MKLTCSNNIVFIMQELEMYDEELVNKPAILAINKCDTDEDGTKFEAIKDSLKVLKGKNTINIY